MTCKNNNQRACVRVHSCSNNNVRTGTLCTICRDPLRNRSVLGRLLCGHAFCPGCIGDWATHCAKNNHTPTCPLCRQSATIVEVVPARQLLTGMTTCFALV